MASSRIYLDHLAAAPLVPAARKAMESALAAFGNPTSQHEEGRLAKDLLEQSRTRVARQLACRPREVVFTPNGTVGSQLALRGLARARKSVSRRIVLSGIEHPAVSDAAADLVDEGFEVVPVPPSRDGLVDAARFLEAVGQDAACAALMLANHETGVVQPVAEVGPTLRTRSVPFLVDACLGPGRLPGAVAAMEADVVVHSAHKWGGPGGLGLLRVKRGTRLRPSITGGNQEEGLSPGTENVLGAAGASAALTVLVDDVDRAARFDAILDAFLEPLRGLGGCLVVGGDAPRLAGVVTLELDGVEGEAAMINLDLQGVAVSTGSACALGAAEPSATLLAMGMSRARAASTIRVSVGDGVDDASAAHAGRMLREVVIRLRQLASP